jgi:hypothetical protein
LGLCTMLWLNVPPSWWTNEWTILLPYWPASTSQAKCCPTSHFLRPWKGCFWNSQVSLAQNKTYPLFCPSVTVTGLKSLQTSYNADIFSSTAFL